MNAARQTICLSMIVKNEAPVIRRCLDSVRPLIDYWVIVDTGSIDGTQDIIRDHLRDLPGELYERPWQDFSFNRSEALSLSRPHGDYSLIIDADDTLEIPEDYQLPELTSDAYFLEFKDAAIQYQRLQLVRNTLPWCYVGVLHEFLAADGANAYGNLPIIIRRNHDGARRRDPATYQKDAAVLEAALERETDPFLLSRYTFYLAQSYRDSGEKQKSLEKYLERAELGFWQEEVFVSLLQAARLKEQLGHSEQEVFDAYTRASNAAPARIEALHGASWLCRLKNRYEDGYQIATRGLNIDPPAEGLFVETWIYNYGLLDELSVNAYWSGHYQEAIQACATMLSNGKLPAEHRERVIANANFSRQKLATLGAPTHQADEGLSSKRPKIAIYSIALNVANHVERWCAATADADYRVVADAGSSDDTAKRLTAAGVQTHRIRISPWRFDDARNAVLALTPGDADICVALDMNELMPPGWRAQLESVWKAGTTRLFYNATEGKMGDSGGQEVFRDGKIHSRTGYRWKRIVHEDLQRTAPAEQVVDTGALLIFKQQGFPDQYGQYLPLLERASQEDSPDAELSFRFARELFIAGDKNRSAENFLQFLSSSDSASSYDRSEAMRYLAKLQQDKELDWLLKSVAQSTDRREPWSDLAEFYHNRLDWVNLLWACSNGIQGKRRLSAHLDQTDTSDFRLNDLMALACSHLGRVSQAIRYGAIALKLKPGDARLANNLAYYHRQRAEQHSARDRDRQIRKVDRGGRTQSPPGRRNLPKAAPN